MGQCMFSTCLHGHGAAQRNQTGHIANFVLGCPLPGTPSTLTPARVQALETTPPSTPSPDAEPSNPVNTAIVGALAHMVQFYGLQGPYTGDMDEVLDVDYSDLLSSA